MCMEKYTLNINTHTPPHTNEKKNYRRYQKKKACGKCWNWQWKKSIENKISDRRSRSAENSNVHLHSTWNECVPCHTHKHTYTETSSFLIYILHTENRGENLKATETQKWMQEGTVQPTPIIGLKFWYITQSIEWDEQKRKTCEYTHLFPDEGNRIQRENFAAVGTDANNNWNESMKRFQQQQQQRNKKKMWVNLLIRQ